MNRTGWEIPSEMVINDSNLIEFNLHPDGVITDIRFVKESTIPILNEITKHTIELAHVKYPHPPKKTLIRFHVNYDIAKKS